MKTIYSTQGIVGDRGSLWRNVIRDVYAHVEIDVAPSHKFIGHINRTRFGEIEITDVHADSEEARRTRQHISRTQTGAYIYLLVKEGELNVEQFGRTCVIGPGQFALLDLDEPYRFSHTHRVHKIGLKLPRPLLRLSVAEMAKRCAISHPADTGVARLAADYICGLSNDSFAIADAQSYLLSRAASDLIFLSLDSCAGGMISDDSAVRSAIRRRAEAYFAANYSCPDLSPQSIANGIGVSVRYLHECFERSGRTVMQQLKMIRLERALAEIQDPTFRHEQINRIAIRNGFCNVTHFSDAFKARFEMTPSQARAAGREGARRTSLTRDCGTRS